MANRSMPFRFLDLPPELRMRVYPYLLEEDRGISIRHSKTTKLKARAIGTYWTPLNMPVALLATCKIINKEATPVLYGNNSFSVDPRTRPLQDHFLEKIGGSIRYLRRVTLAWANKRERHAMLVRLKKAVFLTELGLPWYLVSHVGIEAIAKELGPLIRSLHKSQRKDEERKERKVSNIIVVPAGDRHSFRSLEKHTRAVGEAKQGETEIRDILEKTLK
ncbi:Hypothetical predicted protein [Lecanosticta acicola]|uniref:F-box domain-containing protein n=1 Tax=Lecanosticta acicola TaxID=111012 RepID=A0AAI8YWX0_9PEZI|nr:Hypothetical predicted protein [Lecanosticta acicola]